MNLKNAFRQTLYRVLPAERFPAFELVVDEESPALEVLLTRHGFDCWAWLTSVNPHSQQLADAANRNRLSALERDLQALGLPFFPGLAIAADGSWPAEPSFLVLGLQEHEALELARLYGQTGFLLGRRGQPVELRWTGLEPKRESELEPQKGDESSGL